MYVSGIPGKPNTIEYNLNIAVHRHNAWHFLLFPKFDIELVTNAEQHVTVYNIPCMYYFIIVYPMLYLRRDFTCTLFCVTFIKSISLATALHIRPEEEMFFCLSRVV